jgi:hypothetical protein
MIFIAVVRKGERGGMEIDFAGRVRGYEQTGSPYTARVFAEDFCDALEGFGFAHSVDLNENGSFRAAFKSRGGTVVTANVERSREGQVRWAIVTHRSEKGEDSIELFDGALSSFFGRKPTHIYQLQDARSTQALYPFSCSREEVSGTMMDLERAGTRFIRKEY